MKCFVLFTDENECQRNNGGCEMMCTNTVGSFQCSCNAGFALSADNFSCDGKELNEFLAFYVEQVLQMRMNV